MKPRTLLAVTASVVLIADQIAKAVMVWALDDGESVRAIDGILRWTLQRNPGAAFGIFRRAPVLFTVLAIAVTVVVVAAAPRVRDRANAVALGLVLGGAVGNLVDRLFRPPGPFRGRVVDFIDLRVWPTFNLADAAVVAGAALLAIASLRADRRESERARP